MEDSSIKLHHYLASAGVASRRKSEELIRLKQVTVNGRIAHIGQRVIPGEDAVKYKGKSIVFATNFSYILVNKPEGVVTTISDELGRPTILSLVPDLHTRLYPVGRLDVDSKGLVLLTNDGELANVMTHPKFGIEKTYLVTTAGIPSIPAIRHLERGVRLKEGYTNPATVQLLKKSETSAKLSITIDQGWNRQVRRMFERVGYEIVALERVQFGPFTLKQLDGAVWKEITLSKEEREEVMGSRLR